ncbi:hypothetical protein D3C78_1233120 [compost metagenome]
MRRHRLANRLDNGQQQTRAIFQGATPLIGAPIGEWRKELADQVTVGGVDLHPGKTGFLGQCGAGGEASDHLLDVVLGHGLGFGEHLRKLAEIQRDRRWRQGLLAEVGHGLAARMVELHPEVRTAGPTDTGPLAETIQVALVFQGYTAGAGHGAAVDHHIAGQQQAGFTLGPGLIQAQQRLVGHLIGVGEVLFHRGFGNAIADGLAVGQIQGLEGGHA